MRVLGVNSTNKEVYLAVADGGFILAGMPERFTIPNGMALGADLVALRDDARRRLREVAVEFVAILAAEPLRQASHASWAPRMAAETIVRIAAAENDVPSEVISRQKVRSLLGLPASGKLDGHVSVIVPDAVGAYWSAGRNVAALAALAVERRG